MYVAKLFSPVFSTNSYITSINRFNLIRQAVSKSSQPIVQIKAEVF
jgi:hypothetical protein